MMPPIGLFLFYQAMKSCLRLLCVHLGYAKSFSPVSSAPTLFSSRPLQSITGLLLLAPWRTVGAAELKLSTFPDSNRSTGALHLSSARSGRFR